jgi:hypothetical protein
MIKKGLKDITGVYIGQRAISAVYVGARLVWSAISSCFGSGFWRGDKPWSRTDGWRRNK